MSVCAGVRAGWAGSLCGGSHSQTVQVQHVIPGFHANVTYLLCMTYLVSWPLGMALSVFGRSLCKPRVLTVGDLLLQASHVGNICARRSHFARRRSGAEVEEAQEHQAMAGPTVQLQVSIGMTSTQLRLCGNALTSGSVVC